MDYLIKPWAHQLEAQERAKSLRSFGLFFEQGTGKTGTAINILRYKYAQQGRMLRTLIIGPPIIVQNWRDEWAMHSKIPRGDVIPLVGPGKKRLKDFMEHALRPKNLDPAQHVLGNKIFVTNYEALLMKDLFAAFKLWQPEVLIFDECHRIKNYKSQRAKLADELAN